MATSAELGNAMVRGGIGLREAFSRLQTARDAQLAVHVANATVEAAMWIAALDDLAAQASGDVRAYRATRDGDPDGQVVMGLRWARDRGVYSMITDQHWEQGLVSPLTSPAGNQRAWRIIWGPVSPSSRPEPNLIAAYEAHCLGNGVDETLMAAARWFQVALV